MVAQYNHQRPILVGAYNPKRIHWPWAQKIGTSPLPKWLPEESDTSSLIDVINEEPKRGYKVNQWFWDEMSLGAIESSGVSSFQRTGQGWTSYGRTALGEQNWNYFIAWWIEKWEEKKMYTWWDNLSSKLGDKPRFGGTPAKIKSHL